MRQEAGPTVFAPFLRDTDHFGSRDQRFMVNFRVRVLGEMLSRLREEEEVGAGAFAWIVDPEGNRVELWQPEPGGFEQPGSPS